MNAVETLREAARLMRERAQAATPGPWAVHEDGEVYAPHLDREVRYSSGSMSTDHTFVTSDSEGILPSVRPEEAEHIASWHPAVALAVADWLDRMADKAMHHPTEVTVHGLRLHTTPDTFTEALAVARTYLGEQT